MSIREVTKKQLLALPVRDWDKKTTYDSIILCKAGKHDSKWALIAVVGVVDFQPKEIAAYCDDINYKIEDGDPKLGDSGYTMSRLRTDMTYPSGLCHVWGDNIAFEVGHALSSTDIKIINKERP